MVQSDTLRFRFLPNKNSNLDTTAYNYVEGIFYIQKAEADQKVSSHYTIDTQLNKEFN